MDIRVQMFNYAVTFDMFGHSCSRLQGGVNNNTYTIAKRQNQSPRKNNRVMLLQWAVKWEL